MLLRRHRASLLLELLAYLLIVRSIVKTSLKHAYGAVKDITPALKAEFLGKAAYLFESLLELRSVVLIHRLSLRVIFPDGLIVDYSPALLLLVHHPSRHPHMYLFIRIEAEHDVL